MGLTLGVVKRPVLQTSKLGLGDEVVALVSHVASGVACCDGYYVWFSIHGSDGELGVCMDCVGEGGEMFTLRASVWAVWYLDRRVARSAGSGILKRVMRVTVLDDIFGGGGVSLIVLQ